MHDLSLPSATTVPPLISVMIPVYEPNHLLLKTLSSVLQQQPTFSPGAMQIVLLDDASPNVDVAALISQLPGAASITIYRNKTNLGLAGNWNRAIEFAQGEFIHILHQDDVVLPGFYQRLIAGLQGCPPAGMAFCRHAIIDAEDNIQRIAHQERWHAGVLRNWLARISTRTRIQCPAAIVRRATYEALGDFRTDLKYALDWEMWVRIATCYPVWYEPQLLAHYRRHAQNESARLAEQGGQDPDVLKTIAVFSPLLPEAQRAKLTQNAYRYFVRSRLKQAHKLVAAGDYAQATTTMNNIALALPHIPVGWSSWRIKRKLGALRRAVHIHTAC